MRTFQLFLLILFISKNGKSQVSWDNVPVHKVKEVSRSVCYKIETEAKIDSALWIRFLDASLYIDSLKETNIPSGKYFLHGYFVVDKDGGISLVKFVENPYGLGEFAQKRISSFPYKWSPATQNGHPVKSYHRIILEFDLNDTTPAPSKK